MTDIVQIKLWQFALIYLLLLVVISVMRFGKINKTRSVLWASVRMSLQLTLAGLILTYIFQNPHPLFIVVYLAGMIAFAIFRVFSINKRLNPRFRLIVAASIAFSGLMVTAYFVWLVVGESLGNPRYVIPIAGMVMGNTMTGVSLGLKTFYQLLEDQTVRIETLQNMGVKPDKLFLPLVRQAMETHPAHHQLHAWHRHRIAARDDDRPNPLRHAADDGHPLPDRHHDRHLHHGMLVHVCVAVLRVPYPVQ